MGATVDLTPGDKLIWMLEKCTAVEYRDNLNGPSLWVSYRGQPFFMTATRKSSENVIVSLVEALYEKIDKEPDVAHT